MSPQVDQLRVSCPVCNQAAGRPCLSTVWSPGMDEVPAHAERVRAALPTEPCSVIRATWFDGGSQAVLTLIEDEWLVAANITNYRNPTQVADAIRSFEITAEPKTVWGAVLATAVEKTRHDTADEIINKLQFAIPPTENNNAHVRRVAAEYGVTVNR